LVVLFSDPQRSFSGSQAVSAESADRSKLGSITQLGVEASTSDWLFWVPDVTGSQGVRSSNLLSSTGEREMLESQLWLGFRRVWGGIVGFAVRVVFGSIVREVCETIHFAQVGEPVYPGPLLSWMTFEPSASMT